MMQIKRFQIHLAKAKFIRKQTVYAEGQSAKFIYIVKKGEFVLERALPKSETQATAKLTEMLGCRVREKNGAIKVRNVLSHTLKELKDFP